MNKTNHTITVGAGDNFDDVAQKAQIIAVEELFRNTHKAVEFRFNGIICVVDEHTNLEWLFRDYCNAHTMNWTTVGPDCKETYPADVQIELDIKNKEAEEEMENYRQKMKREAEAANELITAETQGLVLEVVDEGVWQDQKAKNSDSYGKCIIDFAETWGLLMQAEIAKGRTVAECASKAAKTADKKYGITGFMYGAAVSTLSHCWKYGEELRKWHNKDYGHEGDGVVNPAILTITAVKEEEVG